MIQVTSRLTSMWRAFALAVLAVFLSLSVYLVNGAPLFYFDTAGYISQGEASLSVLGFPDLAERLPPAAATDSPASSPEGEPAATDSVVGSRSLAYGVMLALMARFLSIDLAVLVNMAAIWAATWIAARRIVAERGNWPAASATSLGLIAASFGALPFYVAFLMPDILAPALVLCLATLCVWAHRMSRAEIAGAVALSLVAILAHPTHLALALTLLPACLILSPVLAGRWTWGAVALIGLLAIVGLSERLVFSSLVERLEHKSVIYLPFVTARLIDDGPGLSFLDEHCPDVSRPTCALHAALQVSTDPRRLDAPNILFSRHPDTGSYATLAPAVQEAVAQDQIRFAGDVLHAAPWSVMGALVENVAMQLAMFRIDMTLHNPGANEQLSEFFGRSAEQFRDGRLVHVDERVWSVLAVAHGAVYGISLVAIGLLVLAKRRADLGAFALLVVLGILFNALICGGISEPADRYQARMMLLLPLAAALLARAAPR